MNCPNCNGSIWLFNEEINKIYCFYCGFVDSKENRLELEKLKLTKGN